MTVKQKEYLMDTNSGIPERVSVIEGQQEETMTFDTAGDGQVAIQEYGNGSAVPVALFVDPQIVSNEDNALSGIGDGEIAEFSWLTTYHDPIDLRKVLSEASSEQAAWIMSESPSDGLNLAAALKKDTPTRTVCLCSKQGSGSLFSRCKNAGVEPVFGKEAFEQLVDDARYANLSHLGFGALKSPEENLIIDSNVMGEEIHHPLYDNYVLDDYVNQELLSAQNALHPVYDEEAWFSSSSTDELNDPYFGYDAYYGFEPSIHSDVYEDYAKESVVAVPDASKLNATDSHGAVTTIPTSQECIHDASVISQNHKSFIMSVVSGSGGVGKSSIALLSAMLLQMRGKRTLLLDGDLQFGDLTFLVEQETPLTLLDLMEHPERIQSLEPNGIMPAYLAAPPQLEQSELFFATLPQTIERMKDKFDAIIINTGNCWSDEHVGLFKISNCTLFVMDQRPVSIHTCNHALEFCTRAGVPMQNFAYALNFSQKQALITPMDVSCALQGVQVYELADGGNEVRELVSAGRSEELIASGNPFSESLKGLMLELVPGLEPASIPVVPKKRRRRFLKKSA